jgi:iron-sulfur cluster repair protein YtfE (RIC family)
VEEIMNLITDYLGRHHADCDSIFLRAGQAVSSGSWAEATHCTDHVLQQMERHIRAEEELLFPAFEDATGMTGGPTAVMRMEHEEIKAIFAALREAMAAQDAAGYTAHLAELFALIEQHNHKEERILYPMLDRILGDQAAAMVSRIEQMLIGEPATATA